VHWAQPTTKCETGCVKRILAHSLAMGSAPGVLTIQNDRLTKKTPRVGGV